LTRRVADDGGGAGGPSPVELAYHWDAAHDWRRALPLTIEAGYAAERAFAFAEALHHYERALELWERVPDADSLFLGDRASLLERAAEMAVLNGEYPRAVELGRAAVAAIPEGIDDARRGLFHERLRWFLWEAGDRAAAESALEAAAALVPDAPPSAARARVLGHLAGLHMFAGRYGDSQREAAAALPHARAVGARTEEAMALGVLGWDTALLGDVDAGVADLRQALGIAQDVGSIEGIALGYATLASLLDLVGRANEAVELAREGRLAVAKFGVARTYGGLLVASEASALLAVGRWDEARDILAESLERATTSRASIALHLQAGRLETAAGHFAEAADHLTRARARDEAAGGSDQRVAILAAVAELAAWQGRSADVRAAATEGLAGLPEVPEPAHAWLAAFGIRGEADAAMRARARRADDEVAEAIRWGDELTGTLASFSGRAGEVLAARYAVVAALGAAERARLHANPDPGAWLVAAEGFEAMERPYPAAYARYREAEARLAAREGRAAAEQPLRRAWSAARDLGAGALAAEVSTLARQARIDLEPSGVRGPGRAGDHGSEATVHPAALDRFGLTDRELEVLRLVAGGWTNRQIADALFISRKTASVHVSNILGKLEVDGRVEAAAIAHRLGLGADAPPPPDAVRPQDA
jgi:DNA-binding CsgD family transcriptional regulator/tetratricopeptide (TPR) repeat protein